MAGMLISLDLDECVDFFEMGALRGSWRYSTPAGKDRQEKALRDQIAEGVI
jgi:hypothetical protein